MTANGRCPRGIELFGEGLGHGQRSSGHVIGRSWPRFPAADLHRYDGPADFLRSDMARHFRALTSRGNTLAIVYGSPHTFAASSVT